MSSDARLITSTRPPSNLIPHKVFFSLLFVPSLLLVQSTFLCSTASGAPPKKTVKREVRFKKTPPEPSGLPIDRIDTLLRHKEYNDVEKILAETPMKPADSDVRHVIVAAIFSGHKDHERAIAEFEKAKRFMQAGDNALCRVARSYANEGNFDRAIELCGIPIKRGNDEESFLLRADCYVSQKRYPQAIADFKELARTNPDTCKKFHLKASRTLVYCGKYEEALAEADAALKCPGGDTDPSAYLTKAQSLEKLKRWPDAVAAVTKGFELAKAQHNSTSEVFMSTALEARARFYDKMGKVLQANADRRIMEKYSKSVMSELVGDK